MTRTVGRAAPLPAQERRQTIIDATLPLLREHGRAVTSRQIATAAGIAEGTIFRVFDDKEALIDAAIAYAFDQEPTRRELQAIDHGAPLEQRIEQAAQLLAARIESVWHLLTALAVTTKPPVMARARSRPPFGGSEAFAEALTELFAQDADRLSVSPQKAGQLLRAVVFAGLHPHIAGPTTLSVDEIVGLLLHGIVRPDASC